MRYICKKCGALISTVQSKGIFICKHCGAKHKIVWKKVNKKFMELL